ncbi:hypothetical protein MTP03_03970 [Tsukamurella sp. PLM1]|nr:hypothetical protein MTP03_03970 [Tsukamurella sp. PLM1]
MADTGFTATGFATTGFAATLCEYVAGFTLLRRRFGGGRLRDRLRVAAATANGAKARPAPRATPYPMRRR